MPPLLVRFAWLKANGYVNSWPDLHNKQQKQGFPVGKLIAANQRVWTEEEIREWWESRPSAKAPLRGAARTRTAARQARSRNTAATETAAT
jgi:hypothetical protein